jgi:hypothetical protein
MGQKDEMRSIRLQLFNDTTVKDLMGIPEEDYNNIFAFRDNYCIAGYGTYEILTMPLTSRILMYWDDLTDTKNHKVGVRPLIFEIWVQNSKQYGVTGNIFDRRQDLIAERIKKLFNGKRIEGFLFWFSDMGDLHSNTQDYIRMFIRFEVKYIK